MFKDSPAVTSSKKFICFFICSFFILFVTPVFTQELKFNRLFNGNTTNWGGITSVAQDKQGYIWLSMTLGNGGRGGLYRYDGSNIISFLNDRNNDNSLANNWAECMIVDSSNNVWVGTWGSGLDMYNLLTQKFTHHRYNKNDASSISNDTVTALRQDHNGNIWIGTFGGLSMLNVKTGKFTRYVHDEKNSNSISSNSVRVIYEDSKGVLWVGCGSPFSGDDKKPGEGGLNRFNKPTGDFIHYLHNPEDTNSIENNKVRALLEDSRGNFWVGTAGDGLHTLNRQTGVFTHYHYDALHPDKLSRPPLYTSVTFDHIPFIHEDKAGFIWIGSFFEGINRYNPSTKKVTHYGLILQNNSIASAKDTAAGFSDVNNWAAFNSNDGLLWLTTLNGNLYTVNPVTTTIPYTYIDANANTFYKAPHENYLWIGTTKGLWRKDLSTGVVKTWRHDALNNNSLCNDSISAMRVDNDGNFWMTTNDGLSRFNPKTNSFVTYRHDEKNTNSLSYSYLNNLLIDHNKNIWLAPGDAVIDKFDLKKNLVTHFDLKNAAVICLAEDKNGTVWAGTYSGVNKINKNSVQPKIYLKGARILNLYNDAKGVLWAGTNIGLYRYNFLQDEFIPFENESAQAITKSVLHIMEDKHLNLWVTTANSLVKINADRNTFKTYGESYGIHANTFLFSDNFKSDDGQLFFGDQSGYYTFSPDNLEDKNIPPQLNFSNFKLGDIEVLPGANSVLAVPVWQSKEIKLKYDQNIFSFGFIAMHYNNPGDIKYLFKLENYDDNWHNIGTDRTAYFFNVPPGNYIFHVKAVNSDGASAEKTIAVIITPPWWKSWWAYTLYAVCFIAIAVLANRFIRNRIIEKERIKSREKELMQAKEIEKSYNELKATQAQLIQSEKMASLGELTAGIAHEIQNPLNFINNFSDVNKELLIELREEIKKGNTDEANAIATDVIDNEEKINHHGKRADAIVKGMLQHSRQSSGKKEPTDINALCDEYLRLSYHGLRAKDKSFNADFKTDFDESIYKINIVPQDIGRVLLNIINNAFYAANEKKKTADENYQPLVSVQTKRLLDKIEITVSDNGNGIPQKIIDKIFQPFFTTKPTGQGTGLGLSLAYDIITKEHNGSLQVQSNEGEGSVFVIQLPV